MAEESSQSSLQPVGLTSALLALLTAALWAGTPVAILFSGEQLPPFAIAALRFLLATGTMVVWCRVERVRMRPERGEFGVLLTGGVLLFVQIGLFNMGVVRSSSSHATVLINMFVVWVACLDHFVTRTTRLTPARILGLLLAASGGLIVVAAAGKQTVQRDLPTLAGDAFLLSSSVVLAIKIAYTKHAVRKVAPSRFVLWHMVWGTVLFSVWSVCAEDRITVSLNMATWTGLVYQGVVVAGVCVAIQTHLLRHHPASQIAVFSCTTPLFGIALSALLRGDRLSLLLLVAGVCVAIGILLVTKRSRDLL